MTRGSAQLALDLGHRPALGAEDFLVSPANASAVASIDRWPDWGYPALLIVGPEQSGKSHLANVWRLRADAAACTAAGIGSELLPVLLAEFARRRTLVVEDLDRGIADEQSLFHLINLAREERRHLLLTSRSTPAEIAIAMPDLRSRLRAMPTAIIAAPDDLLMRALLVKHFCDRQLEVDPAVVSYLARHIERSARAAAATVAAIDLKALAERRRVTRALAGEVIGRGGLEED